MEPYAHPWHPPHDQQECRDDLARLLRRYPQNTRTHAGTKIERNQALVRAFAAGGTWTSVARDFGITPPHVRDIVHRELRERRLLWNVDVQAHQGVLAILDLGG